MDAAYAVLAGTGAHAASYGFVVGKRSAAPAGICAAQGKVIHGALARRGDPFRDGMSQSTQQAIHHAL